MSTASAAGQIFTNAQLCKPTESFMTKHLQNFPYLYFQCENLSAFKGTLLLIHPSGAAFACSECFLLFPTLYFCNLKQDKVKLT